MKRNVAVYFACVTVLLCLISCGKGGGPAGPSSTQVLTILSGEDRHPVAGAAVQVDGRGFITDGAGQVLALPLEAVAGREIAIQAPGYLDRLTRYRGDLTLTLWPLGYGTTSEYLRQLIFHEWTPAGRLSRITASRVSLVPGPGFIDDPVRMDQLRASAAEVSALNGNRVLFEVVQGPVQGTNWTVSVDDNDPYMQQGYAGAAYIYWQGNVSTGGRVVVAQNRGNIHDILNHELGHTLGLGHSPDLGDRMYYRLSGGEPFSAKERLAAVMMYQRMPGTLPPDNDLEQQGSVRPLTAGAHSTGQDRHQEGVACPF